MGEKREDKKEASDFY